IIGRDNSYWIVQTATGTQLHANSTLSTDWQPGQQALACCRPDELLTDLHQTPNRLQGRVQLVEYMGKSFEALVHLDALSSNNQPAHHTLLAHSPIPLENNAHIDFEIAPERLLLFP